MKQFKAPRTGILLDGILRLCTEDEYTIDGKSFKAGEVIGDFQLDKGWHFVAEPTIVAKTGGSGAYIVCIATFVPFANEGRLRKDHKSVTLCNLSYTYWTLIGYKMDL